MGEQLSPSSTSASEAPVKRPKTVTVGAWIAIVAPIISWLYLHGPIYWSLRQGVMFDWTWSYEYDEDETFPWTYDPVLFDALTFAAVFLALLVLGRSLVARYLLIALANLVGLLATLYLLIFDALDVDTSVQVLLTVFWVVAPGVVTALLLAGGKDWYASKR